MKDDDRLDLLVFGAHPDDAEIGMGGAIALHASAGYRIGVCDLTEAEMSSNGTVELRRQEAAEASGILQLAARTNLRLPDRGLYMTKDYVDAVTEQIRRHRPTLVFAPYWQDRHPDHVACSRIVEEAVFNAKLRRYATSSPAWTVEKLVFYFINDTHKPDIAMDVSAVYERKLAALKAYASQFTPSSADNGLVDTPLNNGYLERVEARDRLLGQSAGVRHAEGFINKQPHVVRSFLS